MTPRDLIHLYPYMFSEKAAEEGLLLFYRGWFGGFVHLCQQIDEALGSERERFRWVQLKEKFGSARYYWRLAGEDAPVHLDLMTDTGSQHVVRDTNKPSPLSAKIRDLVQAETARTQRMCIACGEPGQLYAKGWQLVLCPTHTSLRERGEEFQYWLGLDDGVDVDLSH